MNQTNILRLDNAPEDPIERILWLDGVRKAVERELDCEYQQSYFNARLTGRFVEALTVGRASRKRALAWTRRQNEATGRTVRWSDGLDPLSG